ncbi:MAG: Eco57I restriction-modification methylase domain-containing protein [Desulfovibrionaceae bacterium]|nr:Eco57I restriction-modification methylase domain-containing protein [Desulfovibrionaceae bacterium]
MPNLQHGHNPDVLSCLANLSSDEVFTPPEVANAMLDMLPESIWSDPKVTFLDPACKSGVFLREIAKRLIKGLEKEFPDLQVRLNHIFHKQLFGIALTALTALLSRRSLYCSKEANGDYTISRFENTDGNIRFGRVKHCWKNEKCEYCGASQAEYDRGVDLESHAYEFIHIQNPEKIFDMKFDVIIGNPPYQLNVGVEKENYAIPIYQKFVSCAKKLNPRFLIMIIPARWYAGGRGLDDFRKSMLNDNRIQILHDYPNATDCFPGVQIKAGVCYFLWNYHYHGDCEITTHINNKNIGPAKRPLLENGNSTFIRYNQSITILHKIYKKGTKYFNEFVSPQTPFGLVTSYKGTPQKTHPDDIKMYISGNNKKFKGGTSFTPIKSILKGHKMIAWHKVYIPEAGSGSDVFPHTILGRPFYGEPNTVCNQSYLVIGPFENKIVCQNVISYISTKFFRFLVLQKKNAQHAMRGVYEFVPLQDFSKPWTDAELYAKYGLTEEEISFIESMIKPMDVDK